MMVTNRRAALRAHQRRVGGKFLGLLLVGAGLSACVEQATEHRIRANALFKLGDYRQALGECDKGLETRPDDAALLVLKGKTAFELGDLSMARGAYEKAVGLGNRKKGVFLGDAYLGLAVIASREQRWEDARESFLELIALAPGDASSHANLAKVDLELGKIDDAVDHAEQAARTLGNDEGVLFTLGKVYLAAGRSDDAEKTFEHICQVVPGSSSCPYGVALVALKKGDEPRGLSKLGAAVVRRIPIP